MRSLLGPTLVAGAALAGIAQQRPSAPLISPDAAEFLSHVEMYDMDDNAGGTVRTARISGLNVQVVNGTNDHYMTNSAGNLILGYEWEGLGSGFPRTGSHVLIYGQRCAWRANGGIVGGTVNYVGGRNSVVLSGSDNWAPDGVIISGVGNWVTDRDSVVVGGANNNAGGTYSVTVGGSNNSASGHSAVVSGGLQREAAGQYDWAAGSLSEDM